MRLFIVGTPEPLETGHFLLGMRRNVLTTHDIQRNITNMNAVNLFQSHDDACNYARSLRINRATKIANPTSRQFAPVISVDLMSDAVKYHFNETTVKSSTVQFNKYESARSNFCLENADGTPLLHSAQIQFICLEQLAFELADFKITAAEFPDSNHPVTYYDNPFECTIS